MLILDSYPECGFGNRLLYFINLVQSAKKKGCGYFSTDFGGRDVLTYKLFEPDHKENEQYKPVLGDAFFENNTVPVKSFVDVKDMIDLPPHTVAIHFRGRDFFEWNPEAVLSSEYYIKAINEVWKDGAEHFILFTDQELPAYLEVKKYLEENKLPYTEGKNNPDRSMFVEDFRTMASCDYIISSPSTFCITAGMLGIKKKIMHSREWVEKQINNDDKFWVDLYNGGNEDYSIWKLL